MLLCLVTGFVRDEAAGPSEVGLPPPDAQAAYVGGTGAAVLTFDDGPDPRWTPKILANLRSADVHAVFFLVGERAAAHPDLVRQIAADGNVIGNHTYAHPDPLRISSFDLGKEIDRTNQVLTRITGKRPTLFRPPYGHATPALEGLMAARSMRTVLWDNSPSDYEKPLASVMSRRVVSNAGFASGTIVLLHDGDAGGTGDNRSQTCEALPSIISGLVREGFIIRDIPPPPWTP
jgi:peptidoglycan/xylan/chitin deacetylase (PgdA/CDA1 family)